MTAEKLLSSILFNYFRRILNGFIILISTLCLLRFFFIFCSSTSSFRRTNWEIFFFSYEFLIMGWKWKLDFNGDKLNLLCIFWTSFNWSKKESRLYVSWVEHEISKGFYKKIRKSNWCLNDGLFLLRATDLIKKWCRSRSEWFCFLQQAGNTQVYFKHRWINLIYFMHIILSFLMKTSREKIGLRLNLPL